VLAFAADEDAARAVANTACLAEGPIWTDRTEVTCKEVLGGEDPSIVTMGKLARLEDWRTTGDLLIHTPNARLTADLKARIVPMGGLFGCPAPDE
jgi:hypothetical protein